LISGFSGHALFIYLFIYVYIFRNEKYVILAVATWDFYDDFWK